MNPQVVNSANADKEEHSMPVVVSKLASRTLHLEILTQRRRIKLQQVLAGGASREKLLMSRRLEKQQTMARGAYQSTMAAGLTCVWSTTTA